MHIYLYDTYINEKKFEPVVARIETRITDLGLNGKIIRLGITNSVFDAIENEIKKGAKTIIAVGNSSLLNQAINAIARLSNLNILAKKIPLGFIPVGKTNNQIAHFLGIDFDEEACDILSSRRILSLDLGLANDNYFLSEATISSKGTTVEIDEDYSIEITGSGEIGVINLPALNSLPKNINTKANDGILELFIKTKTSKKFLPLGPGKGTKESIFSFKKLIIQNPKESVLIDNSAKIKAPVEITIANEKINLIVGKTRKF